MSYRDTAHLVDNEEVHDVGAGPSAPPPPSYSEIDENQANKPSLPQPPVIARDELPPPYTPSANVTLHINCKVCQTPISLQGRQNLHVIKCGSCNEATPIKNAPPGKKYIRCPCNCLLICRIDAVRIACPRDNCRRMIALQAQTVSGIQTAIASPASATIRANCAHCNQVFVFLRANAKHKLAICPHCSGRSAVGNGFIRRKSMLFGCIGLFFLLAGIITTVVTMSLSAGAGVYVVWIGAYVVGALNIMRALMFCCVKVSHSVN